MSTETPQASSSLPSYITSATPNPASNRTPWYKSTAPTYAGIFLWFVFWNKISGDGGLAAGGLGPALLGIVLAGIICHFLFYLVPGLLGLKTGLPLYIVGTSTFGALGGLLMPGFLMGVLQFGWLGVNTFYSSDALDKGFHAQPLSGFDVQLMSSEKNVSNIPTSGKKLVIVASVNDVLYFRVFDADGKVVVDTNESRLKTQQASQFSGLEKQLDILRFPHELTGSEKQKVLAAVTSLVGHTPLFYLLCVAWAVGAAFVGLKGIQYVAKVATFLPLIPLAVLFLGLGLFGASAGGYTLPADAVKSGGALAGIIGMVGIIVGFFATAGAAGVDFGMSSRDEKDVQMGGYIGIIVAVVLTAGISVIAVAGAQASHALKPDQFQMTDALATKLPGAVYAAIMIGLTLAAFPGACFSAFIAANSFKTVMPKVNPFVSVGIGTLVSMVLALTGVAGDLPSVFGIIGASFGPICGAMAVDYLLAGQRWSGPRAGFNPAGWIAWVLGFVVGILPNLHGWIPAIPDVPAAPVAAFVVGAVVYFVCAKVGLISPVVPLPKQATAK
jgi:cytosine permease